MSSVARLQLQAPTRKKIELQRGGGGGGHGMKVEGGVALLGDVFFGGASFGEFKVECVTMRCQKGARMRQAVES